tara:strand:- start:488 stop:892 length:405 start_codon:yes stop_codon:yes gene_type:complete
VGDFDFDKKLPAEKYFVPADNVEDQMSEFEKQTSQPNEAELEDIDITSYIPHIQGREWIISETDLAWISTGCYILGTGGGGSPYGHMLRLREIMRSGGVVKVISPDDLQDSNLVACGGGKGSPTVSIEKLPGDE